MASGMMGAMSGVVEALEGRTLFAELPRGLSGWMGACEVLLQERVRAWAFPVGDGSALADSLRVFGRRARIGVRGVRTPQEVSDAFAAGAHFVTSPVASHELLEAAGGRPLALGGLTPNEVHDALGLGATTVQVIPADALGMAYARALGDLFSGAELIASGRLEPFQCEMWHDAGAIAVGLAPGVLFPEAAKGATPDLDALRRRAREFASA